MCLIGLFSVVFGQVSIRSKTYTQNFNELKVSGADNLWNNNITLEGWYAFHKRPNSEAAPAARYISNHGTQATASLYSYGSVESDDRALGSVSSSHSGAFYYGVGFTNLMGMDISSIKITYKGETWKIGNPDFNDRVQFQYSIAAEGIDDEQAAWTHVSDLDITNFNNLANGPHDGNNNFRQLTGNINRLSLAHNSTLWFRWVDTVELGANHGFAIDDLEVNFHSASAAPVPEPATLILSGFAATCAAKRVRSRRARQQAQS